ncbi:acyl-ACP desaturase [bacterium]|nr:acyl-ACP desaturase [bacterium]
MPIPVEHIIALVNRYLKTSDTRAWSRFDEFDWPNLHKTDEVRKLTDVQVAAVRTSLMIEDHIPGYATEYFRLFPVDASVSREDAWRNRNILHFVFQWCAEEDRHAHGFELYMRSSGRVDQEDLTREMVHEGMKKYTAPSDNFSMLFTYTMLQEKATQLYYQTLYQSVEEAPVLRALLKRLFQDEARHCSYFSDLVLLDLKTGGDVLVEKIKTALDAFAMPMADLLDNYKRQAITMIRAAKGYDHRSAFTQLDEIIKRYARAGSQSSTYAVEDFFTAVPNLSPA